MKTGIEWQVSSLELSQKLKELGCPQESLFYWTKEVEDQDYYVWWETRDCHSYTERMANCISAYTVAELGELLTGDRDWFSGKSWNEKVFGCNAHRGRDYIERVEADTEADARAAMAIYLIEQGLLDVKTLHHEQN